MAAYREAETGSMGNGGRGNRIKMAVGVSGGQLDTGSHFTYIGGKTSD